MVPLTREHYNILVALVKNGQNVVIDRHGITIHVMRGVTVRRPVPGTR